MRQADTDVTAEDGKESHAGTAEWVGELLGEWQPTEVRIARGFAECRGLATEQLEDIYQETALALLNRPYGSEEHLRNALRHGIKHRALNMHRDTRRRTQILQQSAPSMHRVAEARERQAGPEEAALQDQDRLIVREFLTELDELEQRVFWLIADGMRYRAIAPVLSIPVNVARNASRSCERKRERFQLLYDTGRLCGYREATIRSLQAGELTSEELARRAFAHLDACVQCRAEHKTNARRLGRTFQDQLATVLPLPALVGWMAWWRRPWPRAGSHVGGLLRERTAALIGAGGAGAKLTAGVATVAVFAGGTIGATQAMHHPATRPHHHLHGVLAHEPTLSSAQAHPPQRAATPQQAAPRTSSPQGTRPHRAVPPSEGTKREFAAEATTGGYPSTEPSSSPTAAGIGESSAREFGPEARHQ